MAGAEGIEPPLRVLETRVLPLNDAPVMFDCDEILTEPNGLSKGLYSMGASITSCRSTDGNPGDIHSRTTGIFFVRDHA
jgi:hypothetical protein